MMYIIENLNRDDPCVNLAIEEYCLRHLNLDAGALLFYVNRPSVIIGRHQNPIAECDLSYLERHRIPLVRRVSGGGAVYHDRGNLNFSFIKPHLKDSLADISPHLAPVVSALERIGLAVTIGDHNDLLSGGRKISGNAQFSNTRFLLIHGTLLVNSNLNRLSRALTPADFQIDTHSRSSVRSPVANIADLLKRPLSLEEVRSQLLKAISPRLDRPAPLPLTREDWRRIEKLAEDKYRSWEWNFGRSADFFLRQPLVHEGRHLVACLNIRRWRVQSVEVKTHQGYDAPGVWPLIDRMVGRPFDPGQLVSPDLNLQRRESARDLTAACSRSR